MKKTISCLALTFLLFSCSKNELTRHINTGSATIKNEKSGATSGPTITTAAVSFLTSATATSGGSVSSGGGGSTVTERGVCYNTSPNPTIANYKVASGSGSGNFTCVLSGLSGSTTYYVRAYATKTSGTTYGNQVSFTTLTNYGTVTDIDGNVYTTITIGTQVWTVENLKTTRYRNGTSISHVTDDAAWASQATGAYCNYNNDAGNATTYGRLYNWYAATDANSIAPAGWHVPSLAEWDVLRNYLGGADIAGGKAKESGLGHWLSPNTGADNSSGFTALPGGCRYIMYTGGTCIPASPALFTHLGNNGVWWSSTDGSDPNRASFVETENTSAKFYRSGFGPCFGYYEKRTGYSVRLVKD